MRGWHDRGMNESIIAACDGASKGNPGPAAWAWVVADAQGTPVRWEAGPSRTATNNVAELTALAGSPQSVDPAVRVEVRMDSQYAMNAVTKWLPGWKRNGWKTSGGKPVANRELVTRIDALLADRAVSFRYVPAHQVDGDPLNAIADQAASEAAIPSFLPVRRTARRLCRYPRPRGPPRGARGIPGKRAARRRGPVGARPGAGGPPARSRPGSRGDATADGRTRRRADRIPLGRLTPGPHGLLNPVPGLGDAPGQTGDPPAVCTSGTSDTSVIGGTFRTTDYFRHVCTLGAKRVLCKRQSV
ncbi:Ribonuclease H [Streptomyces californicus]